VENAVIVSAVRTPVGTFGGHFKDVPATELGKHAVNAALERAGIAREEVDEVVLGCVLQAGLGQNPARQAAIGAVDAQAKALSAGQARIRDNMKALDKASALYKRYVAELDAIKASQANLTSSQRKAIAYWSGGGVMRWNQILRELVARYNLPPAPKDEGGYPVPDAENPFGDPAFPFANPVYAARAYSYVSAAQFDALKSAWYWKFQYNRLSPAKNDNSVTALMPITDLPSYPSEDGVISGVTVEMLKTLFPAAVQEITLKAAEQRNAALWSGKATASDVAAGLALGKSVAAVFLARAAGDAG